MLTNQNPINLNETSIDPNILAIFYDCPSIDMYGSGNDIAPDVCSQLRQVGISKLCGCQAFPPGPSTCDSAVFLTLGESTLSSVYANVSTDASIFENVPCIIDSPSVWFRVKGTGGPLTIDTCNGIDLSDLAPKISVFKGSACDNVTSCVGGNANFDCRFTFISTAGQTYFIVVGGYAFGPAGTFNLTLTDQKNPSTVAPSGISQPTASPSQNPTVTLFPDCNICGSPEKRVSTTGFECHITEVSGLTGGLDASICHILQESNLSATCGCVTPTGNDVCQGAISVSVGQSLNGTFVNSTWDGGHIPCSFHADTYFNGVWYKIVGSGDRLNVNTCQSAEYAFVSVFAGSSCDALQCVSTEGSFCGHGLQLTFPSIKDVTYFLLVQRYTTVFNGTGHFQLNVSTVSPPSNDKCSSALLITTGQTVLGTTRDATHDNLPFCGVGVPNNNLTAAVWYHFKSIAGLRRNVASICGSHSSYERAVSVYTGSCDKLLCVAAKADIGFSDVCPASTSVSWESSKTTDYYIVVHYTPSSDVYDYSFQLALTKVPSTMPPSFSRPVVPSLTPKIQSPKPPVPMPKGKVKLSAKHQ
jgi:hypothetical protein